MAEIITFPQKGFASRSEQTRVASIVEDMTPDQVEFRIGILEALDDRTPYQDAMLRLYQARFETLTQGVQEVESNDMLLDLD